MSSLEGRNCFVSYWAICVGLPGKIQELNLNVGYGTNRFLVYVCPRYFKRHPHAKILLVVYLKKKILYFILLNLATLVGQSGTVAGPVSFSLQYLQVFKSIHVIFVEGLLFPSSCSTHYYINLWCVVFCLFIMLSTKWWTKSAGHQVELMNGYSLPACFMLPIFQALKPLTKNVQIAVEVLALIPNPEYSLEGVSVWSLQLETDSSCSCWQVWIIP